MISFDEIRDITEWWEANAKGRVVGVLLRGQRREIKNWFIGDVVSRRKGWVLGFPDREVTHG